MKNALKTAMLLTAVLCGLFFAVGCTEQNEAHDVSKEIYLPDSKDNISENNTTEAKIGTINKKYHHEAVYDNPYIETISFKADGVVSFIETEDGQKVKKGDILAQLNTDDIDKKIEEQKLRLDSVKKTLSKIKSNKHVDANELASAEYDVQIEQNAYDSLQNELENYTVRAPYKGEINVNFEEGQQIKKGSQVKSGQALCTMKDQKGQKLCIMIYDDEKFEDVGFGMNVTLTQGDITERGKITDIVFKNGGENYSAYYYVITPDSKKTNLLHSDEVINATIDVYSKENVVIVPTEAIKTVDNKNYVDVLVDGIKIQTDVEIGIQDESETEIVSGLSGGEEIILQ